MLSVNIFENSFKDMSNNNLNAIDAMTTIETQQIEETQEIKRIDDDIEEDEEDEEVNLKQDLKLHKITDLHSKQVLLLDSLIKFFSIQAHKSILLPIVRQETPISLRLLDWLVTNYSKKHNIRYELGQKSTTGYILSNKNFNLWADYKNQLKSYSKKNFDPFCRRQRIFFNTKNNTTILIAEKDYAMYNNDKDGIVTTPAQLAFFRWCILNKVIDYALDNTTAIESDMLSSADERNKNKGSGFKRSLSKNSNVAKSHQVKVIIQFN